jgi:hypothetical protein
MRAGVIQHELARQTGAAAKPQRFETSREPVRVASGTVGCTVNTIDTWTSGWTPTPVAC